MMATMRINNMVDEIKNDAIKYTKEYTYNDDTNKDKTKIKMRKTSITTASKLDLGRCWCTTSPTCGGAC